MTPLYPNQALLSELAVVLVDSVFVSFAFSEVSLVFGFSLGPLEERRE